MDTDAANIFRILVATDNHLGYKWWNPNRVSRRETDPVVGNDTFEAFEYILKTAREMHVGEEKGRDG